MAEDSKQGNQAKGQSVQEELNNGGASASGQKEKQVSQNTPISPKASELEPQIDQEIGQFKQELASKSNSELKQLSQQLESVEREMLLEKIDNELLTIKETIIDLAM